MKVHTLPQILLAFKVLGGLLVFSTASLEGNWLEISKYFIMDSDSYFAVGRAPVFVMSKVPTGSRQMEYAGKIQSRISANR